MKFHQNAPCQESEHEPPYCDHRWGLEPTTSHKPESAGDAFSAVDDMNVFPLVTEQRRNHSVTCFMRGPVCSASCAIHSHFVTVFMPRTTRYPRGSLRYGLRYYDGLAVDDGSENAVDDGFCGAFVISLDVVAGVEERTCSKFRFRCAAFPRFYVITSTLPPQRQG